MLRWGGRLGHDPELALGMMDECDGMAASGGDGPTAAEKIDLVVGVDAAAEVDGQVEIQQAGVWTGTEDGALLFLGLGAGIIGGEPGRAADGAILACQFAGQEFLSGGVSRDFLVSQQRDDTFLERAKAAFDFALGLRAGRDQMGDAQGGERALELGARIATLGQGLIAEQGQAVGVEGQRQAVEGKSAAEVLEVMPGGVGGDKDGGHELARVVIHCQQQGLFIVARPPLVDGGVVLP